MKKDLLGGTDHRGQNQEAALTCPPPTRPLRPRPAGVPPGQSHCPRSQSPARRSRSTGPSARPARSASPAVTSWPRTSRAGAGSSSGSRNHADILRPADPRTAAHRPKALTRDQACRLQGASPAAPPSIPLFAQTHHRKATAPCRTTVPAGQSLNGGCRTRAGQSKPSPMYGPVATTSSGGPSGLGCRRARAAARALAPMPPRRITGS